MTLEQIKLAARSLPLEERAELSDWMMKDDAFSEAQKVWLQRQLQVGLEEADRGELVESVEVFAGLRAGLRDA